MQPDRLAEACTYLKCRLFFFRVWKVSWWTCWLLTPRPQPSRQQQVKWWSTLRWAWHSSPHCTCSPAFWELPLMPLSSPGTGSPLGSRLCLSAWLLWQTMHKHMWLSIPAKPCCLKKSCQISSHTSRCWVGAADLPVFLHLLLCMQSSCTHVINTSAKSKYINSQFQVKCHQQPVHSQMLSTASTKSNVINSQYTVKCHREPVMPCQLTCQPISDFSCQNCCA